MYSQDVNKKIACRMFSGQLNNESNLFPVGYTYFGQFISHELIPSTFQRSMTRQVTGYMNLDSIYGSAPAYTYKFAPQSLPFFNSSGLFKVNEVKELEHDLVRIEMNGENIALIPESRNDENQIIAQFHLLFVHLHNKLLKLKLADNALEARIYTTLIFQLLVIEDFLKHILTSKVHSELFKNNAYLIDEFLFTPLNAVTPTCFLPALFTHATWRYGHSNIQDRYHLNDSGRAPTISDLLRRNQHIPKYNKINWTKFFNSNDAPKTAAAAAAIDTKISSEMNNLSSHYSANNIVVLNLLASELFTLPSGYKLYQALSNLSSWPEIENMLELQPISSLATATFEDITEVTPENLPLWLYILLEAQTQSVGAKLGPLGSLINGTVIRKSIAGATVSVFDGVHYSFDSAHKKLGKKLTEIFNKPQDFNMINIINFIYKEQQYDRF